MPAAGQAAGTDDPTVTIREFLNGDRWTMRRAADLRGFEVNGSLAHTYNFTERASSRRAARRKPGGGNGFTLHHAPVGLWPTGVIGPDDYSERQ